VKIYYTFSPHFSAAKKNSKNGNSKEQKSQSAHSTSNPETANVEGCHIDSGATGNKSSSLVNTDDGSDLQKATPKDVIETSTKEVEEEEVELDNLFFEDSSAWDAAAPEILKQQKLEKLAHDGYGHLLGNIDDIWKKVTCFYTLLVLMEHVSCLVFCFCYALVPKCSIFSFNYREIVVKCQKLFYKSFVRNLVGKHLSISKYLRRIVNWYMPLMCYVVLLAVVGVGRLEA
jgi:hypothetical protein